MLPQQILTQNSEDAANDKIQPSMNVTDANHVSDPRLTDGVAGWGRTTVKETLEQQKVLHRNLPQLDSILKSDVDQLGKAMDTITEDGRSTDQPLHHKAGTSAKRPGGADALVEALEQSLCYNIGQEEAATRELPQ